MGNRTIVYLFILFIAIYSGVTMLLPSDPSAIERYDVSELQLRLLSLSVALPLIMIWLVALYGIIRFRTYALLVKESGEGQSLRNIANGLTVLGFSLPIVSLVSRGLGYLSDNNSNLVPAAEIIKNYVGVVFALIAFYLLAKGARRLITTLKASKQVGLLPPYLVPAVILFSSLFTWLVVSRPFGNEDDINFYYLPNWLLILTLAVPYLFAWYFGVVSFYYLHHYQKKVKGLVYKQAFNRLAKGIAIIVFTSVFVQTLVTLSSQLNRLDLTPILGLVYLLIILYAVGYGFVARGAKKLKYIEEV